MLGRKAIDASIVYGGAPVIGGANQLVAGELELSFSVEEDQMLVDLVLNMSMTATAADLDITFLLDGVNLGAGTSAALLRTQGVAATDFYTLTKTVLMTRGQHTLEAQIAHAAAPTIDGDEVVGELLARRHPHPATLGHGVDSKSQLSQ